MKNILFATTALVATAGIASADVTFSGKGEAGVSQTSKVEGKAVALKAGSFTQEFTTNGVTTGAGVTQQGLTLTAADSTTTATANDVSVAAAALTTAKAALKAATAGGATDTVIAGAAYDVERAQLALDGIATAAVDAKAAGDMVAYSGYDLNVAVSAETDSGMTFSMGFDMGAGSIADQDDDRTLDAQGSTIGTSALTITSNGYTFKIGQDKLDDLYDDSQNGDVSIAGAMGGLTYSIVHDLDDDVAAKAATNGTFSATDTAAIAAAGLDLTNTTTVNGYVAGTAAVAAVYNTTSYSLGYAVNDALSVSLVGTSANDRGNSANKVSFAYTVNDSLSLTLGHNSEGARDGITKLTATYAIDALTITASYADDKDHAGNSNEGNKASTNLKLGYTQGAVSATFATDESSQWWVNTKYDLGGGASAFATVDHTEFAVAGLSFAF